MVAGSRRFRPLIRSDSRRGDPEYSTSRIEDLSEFDGTPHRGSRRHPATALWLRGADDFVHLSDRIPAEAIQNTPRAELKIYPNLMAHLIEGVEGILQRPYGCGEQTISSTYQIGFPPRRSRILHEPN